MYHSPPLSAGKIAAEFLKKGSPIYIEGRLRTRKWQDKEGAERITTEVIAEQMQMLGGRSGTRTELDNLTAEMEPEVDEAPELDVEDIPF